MKVSEVVEALNLEVFAGSEVLDKELNGGYSSDMLSDVMGFAKEGQAWFTLQKHPNIVAVASLKDLTAIVLVKGIKPEEGTIEKANNEGIALLGSSENAFDVAGKFYKILNP